MTTDNTTEHAKIAIGQLIHHKIFDYRGVVVDVDPFFKGSNEWYETMARSRPPRDRPWYHVLVDDAEYSTYVAERNLEPDTTGKPVLHEDVDTYFESFDGERYLPRRKSN